MEKLLYVNIINIFENLQDIMNASSKFFPGNYSSAIAQNNHRNSNILYTENISENKTYRTLKSLKTKMITGPDYTLYI